MRVFTENEKALLIRIGDGRGNNLYNLIDPWIKGVSFEINTELNNETDGRRFFIYFCAVITNTEQMQTFDEESRYKRR